LLTVTQDFQADYRVKGSKFLSYISPCDTTEEAEIKLSGVRDIHPTATHHCYAFRVNPSEISEHSQDDGEPNGTAGLPILNAIRSANIVNTIIVVVRYYGGTKLGKGGLIEAYGTAASVVIESSVLKKIVTTRRFEIEYSYDQQSLIEKLKHSFTLFEIDSAYTDKVKLVLECPISEAKKFEGKLNSISHLLTNVDRKGTFSRVLS
jgi:uncharacterized YigZ family protein